MSLLVTVLIVVAGASLVLVGFLLHKIGSGLPRRSFQVYNFEPVKDGQPPEIWNISRDKKSGNYGIPDLTEAGNIIVERRLGWAGHIRIVAHWRQNSIKLFHTQKRPIGIYGTEYLDASMRAHIDDLQHENSILAEKNAELQGLVEDLQRGVNMRVDERFDKQIKAVKEIMPMTMKPQQRRQ